LSDAASREPGAIAFTDIVGFTEFTADRGDDEAVALLDLQANLVHSSLPGSARIVKELGDGLMLWFLDPEAAVTTCVSLLNQFEKVADEAAPLWVRIGMHWGRPTRRGNDLVGHDVNLAARIVDVAGPSELLISASMEAAVNNVLPGIGLKELGPVVMRGIPDPVRLFEVTRP
jgi:adenylate cyclase